MRVLFANNGDGNVTNGSDRRSNNKRASHQDDGQPSGSSPLLRKNQVIVAEDKPGTFAPSFVNQAFDSPPGRIVFEDTKLRTIGDVVKTTHAMHGGHAFLAEED